MNNGVVEERKRACLMEISGSYFNMYIY